MGKVTASGVSKDMMRSFPIKAGFLVGICGGVWSEQTDVRLGDVVVSQPSGEHGGVVQWDFGKMEQDGHFKRTGMLNKPPRPLLNAVQSLKARHILRDSTVVEHLAQMFEKYPHKAETFKHQGQEHDELFEASYSHIGGDNCSSCDRSRLVQRKPERADDNPRIHYGNIASGDEVVKHGPTRDRIAQEEGILCFEMEAAGLMDSFPCIVIRGVCDYADSHKNKRWQPYAAATAACYAKELLGEVDSQGVEELRLASYRVPFSMQGVPVTNHFIQRDTEMEQLETFFHSNSGQTRQKVFVLHGLGGIGKTQLCVEYVRRHQDKFTAVFWLNGSSRDELKQSLTAVAANLATQLASEFEKELVSENRQAIDVQVDKLLRWLSLEGNIGWLLVLDNVDREWQGPSPDPQAYDFKDFLPRVDHGNVLITTRLSRLQRPEASFCLPKVNNDIGRKMLESRAGRNLPGCDLLLDKLSGLPLALVQAGAYIGQTNMSVTAYIKYYEEEWERLMRFQDRYPLQEYAERSVLTTWKLSYTQVQAVKPEAARLLDQWAFLSPGDVSYELIRLYATLSGQETTEVEETWSIFLDELSFQDSLGVLAQFSLVNAITDTADFSIHPVIHNWSLHNIDDQRKRGLLCERAIRTVAKWVPESETSVSLMAAKRIFSHAKVVVNRLIKLDGMEGPEYELYKIASYMQNWENSEEVEIVLLRTLKGCETASGSTRILTLYILDSLGVLYDDQGKSQKAEEMFLRALKGSEKILGLKHEFTLNILCNVGILYWHQDKIKDAEEMFLRVLHGKEEIFGPKDKLIFEIFNNLGGLYSVQGKTKEAEKMYLQALKGKEEILGTKHRSVLETIHNLGVLYREQYKMKEAEEMFLRALKEQEETLGPKHLSTLSTIDNLGGLYTMQGRLAEAEAIFQQALAGKEEALGREHNNTLGTVNNIGCLYTDQGRLLDAEAMLKRALEGKEKAVGREHTSTLDTVHNIGHLYTKQDRLGDAEAMFKRALTGREEALGRDHKLTLKTADNLRIVHAKIEERDKRTQGAKRKREDESAA